MKKYLARLLALSMTMALLLASCGGSGGGASTADGGELNVYQGENAISDLVVSERTAREVESLNILATQVATDFYVLTNLEDGLLTNDETGALKPGLATEWGTEDGGHTWTFHLREDATWVNLQGEEMGKITAQDFVTGLEWVLNHYKNNAANTSMPMEMIEGAEEYYNMTADMTEEEALALDISTFRDMVGIETPDDYTVVYHCIDTKPYFDTVATYACLYPASAALIEQLGVEGFRACTNETMWYSGPYLLTEYIQGNEKVFEPNMAWWGNSEYTRFNSVTVKMVEDTNAALQLYEAGQIDTVGLGESQLAILNDPSNEYYDKLVEKRPGKYAYVMHFCFDKNNEDGTPDVNWNTAVANENFRQAWYYGLDLTDYLKRVNAINPLKCENDCYTMSNLCFTSDGTDYTELVKQELGLGQPDGQSPVRYNKDLGEQYKAAAMEELSAKGVTFPVVIDYYIPGSSQSSLDSANVLKDCFSKSLGDDFVTLNIKTYVSSLSKEVRTPKLASVYSNGWGADYGDPLNYLSQETIGNNNAYYSENYSNINDFYGEEAQTPYDPQLIATYEEYTAMVEQADTIVDDLDARYAAFAKAEAYYLQHALSVPLYYDISWQLTKINDYTAINAMYGIQSYRYVNWETNSEGYTTEDYDGFAAGNVQ